MTFTFISGPPAEAEGVGEHSDSHCSSRELHAVLRGAYECSEFLKWKCTALCYCN